MNPQWLSAPLRSAVRQRAGGACEYCRVHEHDVFVPHEPDHIIAEQHGGLATLENLALACFHCNRHKGPNVASIDPGTGQIVPLFHPRKDKWAEHFRADGPRIVPLTPVGHATATLLRFNAAERLRVRQALAQTGRFPVA